MSELTVRLPFKPQHIFQRDFVKHARRFNVLVCHRRFGKTELDLDLMFTAGLRSKKEIWDGAYVCPFMKQAKMAAWDRMMLAAAAIPGAQIHKQELAVEFPNEGGGRSKIICAGADNAHAMRGPGYDAAVTDEMSQMKPLFVREVLLPTLSDRKGWWVVTGTPHGFDLLYDFLQMAIADTMGLWHHAIYPISRTLGHIPQLDQEAIDILRATQGEAQFRQEMECDFSVSQDDTLIPIDVALGATKRTMIHRQIEGVPVILGVDVARFGQDESCIYARQGLMSLQSYPMKGVDNVTLAQRTAAMADKYDAALICVDGGRGEGVIDTLRKMGYTNVVEVHFGGAAVDPLHYSNKRTEMWIKMANWLEAGGYIENDRELISALVTPTYHYTGKGQRELESKKEIKKRLGRSPDRADALALTFAVELTTRFKRHREEVAKEINPFA